MNLERALLLNGPFDGAKVEASVTANRIYKSTTDDRYAIYDRSDEMRERFPVFKFVRIDSLPGSK